MPRFLIEVEKGKRYLMTKGRLVEFDGTKATGSKKTEFDKTAAFFEAGGNPGHLRAVKVGTSTILGGNTGQVSESP